jgi:hypothetical protein
MLPVVAVLVAAVAVLTRLEMEARAALASDCKDATYEDAAEPEPPRVAVAVNAEYCDARDA